MPERRRSIEARWRATGDYPDTFARELLSAIDFIGSVDRPGSPFPTARRPYMRRVLLPKSGCHIYFEIDDVQQMIRVLHVWDGRRVSPPKL